MSAPLKPWETSRNTALQRQQLSSFTSPQPTGTFQRPTVFPGIPGDRMYSSSSATPQTPAPRAPPRPPGSSVPYNSALGSAVPPYNSGAYGGYGYGSSYSSPYAMRSSYGGYGGSYGYGGVGSYGSYSSPYSSYGGYGMMGYNRGYGGYGQNAPYGMESSFIQMAEESSRPAFQSLESMVHAFGSVSMMLESTFFAIHSSFRAVLGVAENFGRMRGMLAQVFSALTIFKAVRWAYHQLLVLLRIRKSGTSEKIWAEATVDSGLPAVGGTDGIDGRKNSAWPIVMFMSLVMGGPYLIWKLVRSVLSNIPESQKSTVSSEEPWMVGKAPCVIGKATYSYHAGSADELSFNVGDVITMAPTEKQPYHAEGWLIGRKIGDASGAQMNGPSPIGLVPSNHFKTLYCKAKKSSNSEISPEALPVINEEPSTSTAAVQQTPSDITQEFTAENSLAAPSNEVKSSNNEMSLDEKAVS